MKSKTHLSILAILLIFFGFGMIHGSTTLIERSGSLMIGIGAIYLIFRLLKSILNDKKEED